MPRKRPEHISLRTTKLTKLMLEDTARLNGTTCTEVLEKGIYFARRHFQRYGTLSLKYGATNGDDVTYEKSFL